MIRNLKLITAFLALCLSGKSQCLISGLSSSYCVNSPASTLTTAAAGGSLTGPGVSGNVFNPASAGVGSHTLHYNYCSKSYSMESIPYVNLSNGTYVIPQLPDNGVSAALPIGFTFKFFCDTFSNVYISSNGFISFSPNQPDGCCQGLSLPTSTTAAPKNIIALCWSDLNPSFGGTIRHQLFGTAPNRIFMVNYNCIFHHNNGNGGDPVTGFILLYETSNIIEINLGIKAAPTVTINETTGIQDATGTIAFSVPGKNGTSNWSSSFQAYRFTPGPSCEVTATTNVVNTPTVTLAWGKYTMCRGDKNILSSYGANSYTWSTNATGNFISITPTTTTIYSVTGTGANGCTSSSSVQIKVSECTSLIEYESGERMEVFPNPGNGIINIKTSRDQKALIYSSLGEFIKEVELFSGSVNRIDLSALPAGTYFLLDPNSNKKYPLVLLR